MAAQKTNPETNTAQETTIDVTSTAPVAPTAAPPVDDLGIPHHMQDKKGFCGAACMMMLLGHEGTEKSQSELMRQIKIQRDDKKWKEAKRESDRVAWHASPEEIAAVLTDSAQHHLWRATNHRVSTDLMTSIADSLNLRCGAIALVWSANLDTNLPHWVVISGSTPDVKSMAEDVTGYWILDPTAANRPDGALRYESCKHERIRDSETCPCQSWKDSSGREDTAQRIWVPKDKLEEMLDDGAVKGIGLRYAIVANGTKLPAKPALKVKRSVDQIKDVEDPEKFSSDTSTSVEKKIRSKQIEEDAKISATTFKALSDLNSQPAGSMTKKK